jgi:hypothetical protein
MYTLQEKTWYTWHVCFPCQFTYATRTLPVDSSRTWQPLASHQHHWTDPTAPEKEGSWHNPQHVGWPIRGSSTQFLSQDNHWSSNESQTSVDNKLHRFTGPITLACDQNVQYLLVGANPSVLNRHRWGLQPWRCRLSTYHSLTFPTDGLHFPPKGPVWSQAIQNIPKIQRFEYKEHMAATWSSGHSAMYRIQLLRLAIANDFQRLKG